MLLQLNIPQLSWQHSIALWLHNQCFLLLLCLWPLAKPCFELLISMWDFVCNCCYIKWVFCKQKIIYFVKWALFYAPHRNSSVLERLRVNPFLSWMPVPQNAGGFRPDFSYGFEVLIELEVWKAEILTYITVVRIQVFWQTSEAKQFQQSSLPLHESDFAFSSLTFLLTQAAPLRSRVSPRARVLFLPSGSSLIQLNRDF